MTWRQKTTSWSPIAKVQLNEARARSLRMMQPKADQWFYDSKARIPIVKEVRIEIGMYTPSKL